MIQTLLATLLTGLPQPDPADVEFRRFSNWWHSKDQINVKMTIRSIGLYGEGTGTYSLRKPNVQDYDATFGKARYRFKQTSEGVLEIEDGPRLYNWYPDPLREWSKPVRADGIEEEVLLICFPQPLQTGNLRALMPQATTYKVTEGDPKLAQKNRRVYGAIDDSVSKRALDAWIAEDGTLLKYRILIESPNGRIETEFLFSPNPLEDVLPDLRPPLGYVQARIAHQPLKLAVDSKFPTGGAWIRDGKDLSLSAELRGRRTLVLLMGSNDASTTLAHWLKRLALPKIEVLQVGIEADSPGIHGTGEAMARLQLCATPTLCLVDGSETIRAMWLGFDPSESDEMEADLRQAIAELETR